MSVFLRRLAVPVAFAIAMIAATAAPAQAAAPPVGSTVCHLGPVSGLRCGIVTAVNVTINHPGGPIFGAFLYNACAQPGDGGAPIYLPSTGAQVGTVLGSVGICRTAGLPTA
jgi:streptogrisin B